MNLIHLSLKHVPIYQLFKPIKYPVLLFFHKIGNGIKTQKFMAHNSSAQVASKQTENYADHFAEYCPCKETLQSFKI